MHGALHTTPSLFSLQYHLHLADGEIEVQRDSGIWPRSHSQEVAEWGFDPRSAIPGAVSTSSLLWCLSPCSFSGISSSSISLSWGQRMTKLTLDQMSPFRTEPPGAEFTDNHPGRRIDLLILKEQSTLALKYFGLETYTSFQYIAHRPALVTWLFLTA